MQTRYNHPDIQTRCDCSSVSVLVITGGELSGATRYNHPVKLRRRIQTRCDCSSVSVLDLPSTGGEYHPIRLRRRVQTRCNRPSVSDISPSLRCRHLPSTGGEYHPVKLRRRHLPFTGGEYRRVRLRRRIQTRCDYSSVSVLVISPPQEGNTTPSGEAAGCRRDAIALVYLSRHLPSAGGELSGADDTTTPSSFAVRPPPSADATQSPQCICTRHLPFTGGEWSWSKSQLSCTSSLPVRYF